MVLNQVARVELRLFFKLRGSIRRSADHILELAVREVFELLQVYFIPRTGNDVQISGIVGSPLCSSMSASRLDIYETCPRSISERGHCYSIRICHYPIKIDRAMLYFSSLFLSVSVIFGRRETSMLCSRSAIFTLRPIGFCFALRTKSK